MSFEEMQTFLNNIQAEKTDTKLMNAILTCYQDIEQLKKMVIELQKKVNEVIENWNKKIEGDAAALNDDIQEDISEEDLVDDYTGAANGG